MMSSITEKLELLMDNFQSITFINIKKSKSFMWVTIYLDKITLYLTIEELQKEILDFLSPTENEHISFIV